MLFIQQSIFITFILLNLLVFVLTLSDVYRKTSIFSLSRKFFQVVESLKVQLHIAIFYTVLFLIFEMNTLLSVIYIIQVLLVTITLLLLIVSYNKDLVHDVNREDYYKKDSTI